MLTKAQQMQPSREDDILAKKEAIDEGLRDLDEGRYVSHERVSRWVADLIKGKRSPAPQ